MNQPLPISKVRLVNQHQCQLSVDRTIKLLASARRRRLLRYLAEEVETTVEREELARFLHAEDERDVDTLGLILTHQVLPKLADGDVIQYDHRSGTVRPTRAVEKLLPLLDACEEFEAAWD